MRCEPLGFLLSSEQSYPAEVLARGGSCVQPCGGDNVLPLSLSAVLDLTPLPNRPESGLGCRYSFIGPLKIFRTYVDFKMHKVVH